MCIVDAGNQDYITISHSGQFSRALQQIQDWREHRHEKSLGDEAIVLNLLGRHGDGGFSKSDSFRGGGERDPSKNEQEIY